jgi:RimJ/RimL family protein N-acetyltransferase
MCDPETLRLTCSEPLSLEEEYENQQSWLRADDKLTFILMAPALPEDCPASASGAEQAHQKYTMIGDCNAFLWPQEPEEAEVEVSINERRYRRRGYAQEAIRLLMAYLATRPATCAAGRRTFIAKILDDNEPSIAMFTRMGFTLHKRVAVFEETHFIFRVAGSPDTAAAEGDCTTVRQLLEGCGYEEIARADPLRRHVLYAAPLTQAAAVEVPAGSDSDSELLDERWQSNDVVVNIVVPPAAGSPIQEAALRDPQ